MTVQMTTVAPTTVTPGIAAPTVTLKVFKEKPSSRKSNSFRWKMDPAVIEEQKLTAGCVLDIFNTKEYTGVSVVGGAARNWYLGREARDIDIVVYQTDDFIDNMKITRELLNGLVSEENIKDITSKNSETYASVISCITNVFEFKFKNQKIQLIFVAPKEFHTNEKWYDNFPVSLSKISWTKVEGYDISPDFEYSVKSKNVLYDPNKNMTKSNKYLTKIKKYFGDEYLFFTRRKDPEIA